MTNQAKILVLKWFRCPCLQSNLILNIEIDTTSSTFMFWRRLEEDFVTEYILDGLLPWFLSMKLAAMNESLFDDRP